MEEQFNINYFWGFCCMFLAFYVQVMQETGGARVTPQKVTW
jgi:hypothetical protein